jgi:hypothetical protein
MSQSSLRLILATAALSVSAQSLLPACAQEGIPLPGSSAPVPGSDSVLSAPPAGVTPQPIHVSKGSPASSSAYGQLPLNPAQAKAKIVELTNLVAVSRPQDVQERVYHLCEWLADMADAHNRMANAFNKQDATKAQSNAERQLAIRFSQLKNEAQLLKADLLINQRRLPEAIGPLVDIVLAEPSTNTGKEAYQRLVDMGFSNAVKEEAAPAVAAPAPASKKPPAISTRH